MAGSEEQTRPAGAAVQLSAAWTALGTHRWRFADQLLQVELHGDFDLAEFVVYVATFHRLIDEGQNFGVLADARDLRQTSPEVRKRAAHELGHEGPPIPIAVHGASVYVRTLLALFNNALRLLLRREATTGFFSTATDAQAWLRLRISERARKLQAPAATH